MCISGVLAAGGARASDIGQAVFSRGEYPAHSFTTSNPLGRMRDGVRHHLGGGRDLDISTALMKTGLSRAEEVVDGLRLLAHSGLKPDCGLFFSNHHFAHALPSLFFTD